MGTTADKLNKILESKEAIKQALINKGYSSDEVGDIFSQYGYLIENIPKGEGELSAAFTNANYDYAKDYFLQMVLESYEITKDWTDYSELNENAFKDQTNLDIWFVPLIKDAIIDDSASFAYCKKLLFVPKEIISTKNNCAGIFRNCCRLLYIDIPSSIMQAYNYVDSMFSACTSLLRCKGLDIRQGKNFEQFFYGCNNLIEIYGTSTGGGTYFRMFYGCSSLKKIEGFEIDFSYCTNNYVGFDNMFNGCSSLEEVRFKENTLSVGGLNLSFCTSLSHDSLLSAINACAEVSSPQTLNLGSINLAKLSDDEKLIATNKGWTLV